MIFFFIVFNPQMNDRRTTDDWKSQQVLTTLFAQYNSKWSTFWWFYNKVRIFRVTSRCGCAISCTVFMRGWTESSHYHEQECGLLRTLNNYHMTSLFQKCGYHGNDLVVKHKSLRSTDFTISPLLHFTSFNAALGIKGLVAFS